MYFIGAIVRVKQSPSDLMLRFMSRSAVLLAGTACESTRHAFSHPLYHASQTSTMKAICIAYIAQERCSFFNFIFETHRQLLPVHPA